MTRDELQALLESGRYEEALRISPRASAAERHKAFIRTYARWLTDDGVRRSLSRARNVILARVGPEGDPSLANKATSSRAATETALTDYQLAVHRERGRRLLDSEDGLTAVFEFRKAIESGGDVEDYFGLGRAFMTAGLPWFAVGPFLVSKRGRGSPSDRYWLGRALCESGHATDAVSELQAATDYEDTTQHRFWLAKALAASGRRMDAIRVFEQLVRADECKADYAYWLGATLLDCGQWAEGVSQLRVAARALRIRPIAAQVRALHLLEGGASRAPSGDWRQFRRRALTFAAVLIATSTSLDFR